MRPSLLALIIVALFCMPAGVVGTVGIVGIVGIVGTAVAADVDIGDCVRLQSFSELGVPLHPGAGNNGVSGRAVHGSEANVVAHDAVSGWYQIEMGGENSWIIGKYISAVIECGNDDAGGSVYRVGSWNLEHFKEGKTRGFPENTQGGPTIPPRTQEEYESIAAIIEALDFKILLLQEIYARWDDATSEWYSEELDRLIGILGFENYAYVVGSSGGTQHLAIVYDRRAVRLNENCETNFEAEVVNSKNLFDRQPLFTHFTLLDGGQPANDLVVCDVHLASGQDRTKNHDKAMTRLVAELAAYRAEQLCIPSDEFDLLIAGDFNANRFDNQKEDFWDDLEHADWNVLADDADGYPPTRLRGVPLRAGSVIDYILISAGAHGLDGNEIVAQVATVHSDLAADADLFRFQASDHLPISVLIAVGADEDPTGVIQ